MRKIGFLVAGGAFLLMSVALVDGLNAQQKKGGGAQPGGGFGGIGGFGGGFGGAAGPINLLNNKDVKKELDVTDEQLEQLPAEVLTAISKVLNEKQYKRFKQIELQQRGNRAFNDKAVQTALKVTDEQKKNIGSIIEDANKERAELFKGGFGGGGGGFGKGGGAGEKSQKIDSEARDKIMQVLTKEQRKSWREMVGEELKINTGFGGGAGGFGGFGNKNKGKTDPNKDK